MRMPHIGRETAGDVSREEVAEQLERIFAGAGFRRSDRLQSFLRYICDLTVKGESERINEYLLATEVFHRRSDFASNSDSTVRRQAHLLREKLDQYYRDEGRFDSIFIEVPVGHYVPVFQRRLSPLGLLQPDVLRRAAAQPALRIAAVVVAVGVATFFAGRVTAPGPDSPSLNGALADPDGAIAEFWGPWLHDPQGAVLCFSSPLTAVIKHYAEPRGGDLVNPSLRVSEAEEKTIRQVFEMPSGGYIYLTPNRSQIKKGEGFAGLLLAQLFGSAGRRLRFAESDSLTWDDFRGAGAILFGNSDTNGWVGPLLENRPFRLRSHEGETPRSIVISNPQSTERSAYFSEYPSYLNERRLDYALISMLPGLHGGGRLLLVNGLNHFATQAAVEYLTNPADLTTMLGYLREKSEHARGPWFFQLVLEVEVREGVPTRYHPAALRLLEPLDSNNLLFSAQQRFAPSQLQ